MAAKRQQASAKDDSNEIQAALARVQAKKQQAVAKETPSKNSTAVQNKIRIDLAKKQLKTELAKLTNVSNKHAIATIQKNITMLQQQIDNLEKSIISNETLKKPLAENH
jgi:predicted  nucleic acid-binding Zn-ribbon protein